MKDFNDFNNPQVAKLPRHLKQYIVPQYYDRYTPVDHAVWRYVMRMNYCYLKDVAYYPYIKGLERAGLSIEKIPDLQDMNNNLGKIGWGAVTVDGFIPPAAFMEYQSYKVLVIAADIRQINHIQYTPAPDIIHESAGHAPIIADTDYNNYLSYFGSIGAKAIYSAKDFELYEAIRALSILKEMAEPDLGEIRKAEKKVAFCQDNLGDPSEMSLLSRLHWWTVEYGLIGTLENPKIYGAGLLSSIGESASCMQKHVKKLWYNLNTVNYSYDITKEQPQLFVTPDFQNLIDVLEAFADTMAFRKGGAEGLLKAINCKNTCTAVFSSGLQVSGTLTDMILDQNDQPVYLKTTGESALAFADKQLDYHGKAFHKNGFASPVGKIKNFDKPLEGYTEKELSAKGIAVGKMFELNFLSGIKVSGKVYALTFKENSLVLLSFENCTVKDAQDKLLFEPGLGIYDMAVGVNITSVYCGAADKDAFEEIAHLSVTQTFHHDYDAKTIELHQVYQQIRDVRENNNDFDVLERCWLTLKDKHRDDWLAALEILEILESQKLMPELATTIKIYLELKANHEKDLKKLIFDGFMLNNNPVVQLVTQ